MRAAARPDGRCAGSMESAMPEPARQTAVRRGSVLLAAPTSTQPASQQPPSQPRPGPQAAAPAQMVGHCRRRVV